MTALHLAANKQDKEKDSHPDRRKDCLLSVFVAAIRRGYNFSQLTKTGQTLLHLAVTYANYDMFEALQEAEDHVYQHYPDTPNCWFPNWPMVNTHGVTPLGHWVITKQKTAKAKEQQWLYDFLADRLVDQGWSRAEIQRHEAQQWELGRTLEANKAQSGGKAKHVPFMKHSAPRAKSPQKRRRLDVGAPRGGSSSTSAPSARSPFDPEFQPRSVGKDGWVRKGDGKRGGKSGHQWQKKW